MADNVAVTPGTGATIATDDVGGVQYQRVKVDGGGDGAATPILAGGGVEASALRVTIASDSTGVLSVDDNGASITIDAPVGTPAFVRLSDGSSAITTLPVSISSGATSIGKAEDAASASGDVGVGAMAIQKNTPSNTAADGDYVFLQMSSGRLWVSAEITAESASIGKVEDIASASGDVGVPAMAIQQSSPADTAGTNGDYAMLQMSAGRLWCSASAYGDVAHDAADSGNPIKVGGSAITAGSYPTAVSSGDRAQLLTDLYGRPRVVAERTDVKTLGVYYWHSGILTLNASADGAASAGGGRLWVINPTGSGVKVRIRRITFRSQLSTALVAVTCPRITIEKSTYTGTPSGGTLTPTKRKANDASVAGSVRTAVTGMTVAASTDVATFIPVSSATAVAYNTPAIDVWALGEDEWIELAELDCVVIRQADAGTTSDTRKFFVDIVTEEY